MKNLLSSKFYVRAEFLVLIFLLPWAVLHFHLIRNMIPILWAATLYSMWVHHITTGERFRDIWRIQDISRETLKPIVMRFALSAALLIAIVLACAPERFLSFVSERPILWCLVMLLYPILSVLPQEFIFRSFFFARYRTLFTQERSMVLASATAFGFAHIILMNWVAPVLCFIGGLFFALTYAKRRSLSLATLEHALYGDFIFTLGLGYYFYHGTAATLARATGQ